MVFKDSALTPMAVLRFPIVLLLSDEKPTAVFHVPLAETQKGVLPFCGIASGIAPVRWRTDGLHISDEREADESKCD